jgi:hypothetical protein
MTETVCPQCCPSVVSRESVAHDSLLYVYPKKQRLNIFLKKFYIFFVFPFPRGANPCKYVVLMLYFFMTFSIPMSYNSNCKGDRLCENGFRHKAGMTGVYRAFSLFYTIKQQLQGRGKTSLCIKSVLRSVLMTGGFRDEPGMTGCCVLGMTGGMWIPGAASGASLILSASPE